MKIPTSIRQGDTAYWLDDPYVDDGGKSYTSAAYALTYVIAGPIATPLSLASVANASGWKTSLDTSHSGSLVPGQYWWEAVITGNNERITYASGELVVTVNLANAVNYDGRTLAEKALADAETALATFRSTHGRVKQYTIGQRSFQFDDTASILKEISYWKLRVANERTASSIAQGLGNPRKLHVRFGP